MYVTCNNLHILLFIFYSCSYGNCIFIVFVLHGCAVIVLSVVFLTCFIPACRTTVLLDLWNEYVYMYARARVCVCVCVCMHACLHASLYKEYGHAFCRLGGRDIAATWNVHWTCQIWKRNTCVVSGHSFLWTTPSCQFNLLKHVFS
jgi:hypothetical protein